ncbi:XcbB/CpsF family capsular polysaccharide biosynthesis protein [Brevibacterium sediminis]|uniref:XcbB/CpsF family capsular polysaccharide biosynthesis protein n=1 Tax=Brevibacterium sediminis TaxID=1857024 RepID=A0A5C4WXE0_9MICO|nr:XcbB/CpsF family capsular polysaccharide biosynthesis protein [Brevibacterium sediminis]TNM52970.1 hypothetical protein FHQ09_16940 [Brevibacterium sediminis]
MPFDISSGGADLSCGLRSANFLEVEHRGVSANNDNLIRLGMNSAAVRELVEWLAVRGWFLYKSDGSVSSFVKSDYVPNLWHRITNGDYCVDETGLVYSVDESNVVDAPRSLVVVFSSMSLPHDGAGLSRYFEQNFSSIGRHLGSGAVVLRIADLDGVVGGFYSPTNFVPDRIEIVQSLIRRVAGERSIGADRVVLYGGSKGGTGALLHGLFNSDGWKCIAVDPVVDDSYYENRYNDSHWTGGRIFRHRKTELFSKAVESCTFHSEFDARICIVTSPSSPLFSDIQLLSEKLPKRQVLFASSRSSLIRDHPDVSAQTLRFVTGVMNMWIGGLRISGQSVDID